MSVHPDEDFGSKQDRGGNNDRLGGINPLREVDVDKLRDSMAWSARQMATFRSQYVDSVSYFAGSRYGENSGSGETPLNMMRLAIEIWLRQLVSQSPAALVLTKSPALTAKAYEMELATNFLLDVIKFGRNLSDVVRSALFLLGVMKVGITSEYLPRGSGYTSKGGQPYAEPVLLEDFLYDMNARRQEEWDWVANRYRMPYDLVVNNPEYDKEAKAKLSPETERGVVEDFAGGQENTSDWTAGNAISKTEYRQHVDLWDIWIPGDNLFITLPAQQGLQPLLVREWEGPEHGPFHLLALSTVPGNIMPSAPAQHLFDLQDLLTVLVNQIGLQAKRQKTLTIADGRAVADGTAQAIMEAEDGQVIQATHVDSVREMKYGGVDPGNFGFVQWLKETMSYMAGNLDAMGGLSQQGGTLGQEQLLVQSSSEMLRDMQSKVVTFTADVIKDLAWYLYSDPFLELDLSKQIEGFGEVPFKWNAEDLDEKDFFRYQFRVAPYSLKSKGPEQRLGTIMQLATQVFLPLAPMMGAWGMSLNLKKLVELIAKYSDLPEIIELISSEMAFQGQDQMMPQTPGRRPLQSPSTTRSYIRESRSTQGAEERTKKNISALMIAGREKVA